MELKIIKEEKSALPRKEITCTITYEETTPSRQQLLQSITAKQKTKPELTIVKKIKTDYGEKTATVTAYIYDNEETLKAIEYPKVIEKNTLKKEEKKEEAEESSDAPKEENKEAEAPAEEKKEGEQ